MHDILITLVFMMVFLIFSVWPAVKAVDFIKSKRKISQKTQNLLTLIFTISIALSAALFMKLG